MKYLIVIDMQKDFVTGSLGSEAAQAVVSRIDKKIADGGYDKVFFTFDTHFSYYPETLEGQKLPVSHCVKGTDGWTTALAFNAFTPENMVEKYTFGYTEWFGLLGEEEFIESIELVGVCTDICVVSNALILRAIYPDTVITVDASCCAGTSEEAHKAALTVMKSCQIDITNE